MTESTRITKELELLERRDREWLPRIDQSNEPGYVLPAGEYTAQQLAWEAEKAAVVELCRAEQSHHRYSRAEAALKQAIIELEIVLYPYEEDMRHQNYRGDERQASYDYTKTLFHKALAELKSARKLNNELGIFTGKKVAAATAKVNPTAQKELAEQISEAGHATKFCENFLTWISKQPTQGELNVYNATSPAKE